MNYPIHPIADLLPRMNADEFAALVESVQHRGLIEPIWLYEGQILDGRHRYQACAETGRDPKFRVYKGPDPIGFSVALNLERRHLTTEQRAALGVAVKAAEAERARERQGARTDLMEDLPEGERGNARDIAGARVGVSGRLVDQAEKIAEQAPDVAERMRKGTYGSVAAAAKVAALPEPERERVHEALDAGEELRDVLPDERKKSWRSLHSSDSVEWYTPADLLDDVRGFLGRIDLDPASCQEANEVVQADAFFTQDDDGLASKWFGRVWCNPPYGLNDDNESNQALWSDSMLQRYLAGEIEEGVLLINAMTGSKWFRPMWGQWVCLIYRRLQFRAPKASGKKNQPTHSNALIYFGPRGDEFQAAFSKLGRVIPPLPDWDEIVKPGDALVSSYGTTGIVRRVEKYALTGTPTISIIYTRHGETKGQDPNYPRINSLVRAGEGLLRSATTPADTVRIVRTANKQGCCRDCGRWVSSALAYGHGDVEKAAQRCDGCMVLDTPELMQRRIGKSMTMQAREMLQRIRVVIPSEDDLDAMTAADLKDIYKILNGGALNGASSKRDFIGGIISVLRTRSGVSPSVRAPGEAA